jgi:hypothetical protein
MASIVARAKPYPVIRSHSVSSVVHSVDILSNLILNYLDSLVRRSLVQLLVRLAGAAVCQSHPILSGDPSSYSTRRRLTPETFIL